MTEKKWPPEPWRVVVNGVGGVPGAIGLAQKDSFEVFANGDPDCLSRAAQCVNACKDIIDPEVKIPHVAKLIDMTITDLQRMANTNTDNAVELQIDHIASTLSNVLSMLKDNDESEAGNGV